MKTIVRVIDSITEWAGSSARWVALAFLLVMVFEVTMRYVFNSPTMWAYETSMMLGATLYAVAWAYAQRHNAHIRIDLLYSRLSLRKKAIIDVIGFLLIYLPLASLLIYASAAHAWHAWEVGEVMDETYWYPPAAPLRTVIAIGFCLFALQGGAQFIRDLYLAIRNKTL